MLSAVANRFKSMPEAAKDFMPMGDIWVEINVSVWGIN